MAIKKSKLSDFMRGVYEKTRGRKIPLRAMLELTYKCNHKCLYCYNPAGEIDKEELSTKQWFGVLDELAVLGTLSVAFTGGEVLLRPDITEICLYARKKGFKVILMTNGSLITEEVADRLIKMGIARFEISFLGASKESFDSISQVSGSFDKVVNALKVLKARGVIPQLKTCVTNVNINEITKICEFAKALDVSFSYSPLVIPKLDLDNGPNKFRIGPAEFLDIKRKVKDALAFDDKPLSEKKIKRIKEMNKKRQERPGFWERERLFNCMAGSSGIFINPYGEMKVCMTVPDPSFNVLQFGVMGAWRKCVEFADQLKAPKDWQCYECEVRDWCSWCPGRGYLNTGNIFGCPSYFKELAQERYERYKKNKAKKKNKE
ncbi:MAG: radical SAM protein [Candidatus Omnitrophica bacterium]|jgi:radical SAM protein with 4Fe4S-binding SPASM domain|nr:radical SAM protein [Candidatus Omnitrophota bacterium]MDD5081024.1 radical SAM protein [Candidatus Omnitrophota bacterium]MDD5441168.1 radical SAM protein [Candidatus Omnitrophota bacterium]